MRLKSFLLTLGEIVLFIVTVNYIGRCTLYLFQLELPSPPAIVTIVVGISVFLLLISFLILAYTLITFLYRINKNLLKKY